MAGQYNPEMKNEVSVRSAGTADVPTIVEFNLAMAAETEDRGLDPEVLREGVLGVLRDPERANYVLAEIDGSVVGSLMLTTEWSDWRNGTFLWIQSVYVRPGFRRRGVYRAMHRAVREIAGAMAGVCGIRLYVERENTSAQDVYRAMGMEETPYRLFEEPHPFQKTKPGIISGG